MERLKITAYLSRGQIIFNDELYFDSILYNQKLKQDMGEDYRNKSKKGFQNPNSKGQMQLPIARHTNEILYSYHDGEKHEHYAKDSGVWLCSKAIINLVGERNVRIRKRFEQLRYEDRGGISNKKVYLATGKFKNYDITRRVILTPEVSWIVIGEEDRIMQMLQNVHYIGKECNLGFGKVEKRVVQRTIEQGQRHFPSRHYAPHEIREYRRCLPPYSSREYIWECTMRYF